MAAVRIEAMWDMDGRDHPVLVLEKERGKINLAEVEDLLRHSKRGAFQGNYVLIIRATEETCGGSGRMDKEEPKGDQWSLYQVEAGEPCPVCGELAPPFGRAPMCGESLTGKDMNAEQAMERIDRKIELIGRMQEEMDHRAMVEEKAVQLIAEGKPEEAVAQLNSLDDGILAEIQMEIDTLNQEPTAREKEEERRRKAKIILETLAEDAINMNWNYEEDYLKAITKALKKIEEGGEHGREKGKAEL